jgi:hypothetical protein
MEPIAPLWPDANEEAAPPPAAASLSHRILWWLRLASLALPLVFFAWKAARVVRVAGPGSLSWDARSGTADLGLDTSRRRALFEELASHDAGWKKANARFEDDWSRHDDFHALMSQHIVAQSRTLGMNPTVLCLIYDEAVHAGWVSAKGVKFDARWVPLKPRTR